MRGHEGGEGRGLQPVAGPGAGEGGEGWTDSRWIWKGLRTASRVGLMWWVKKRGAQSDPLLPAAGGWAAPFPREEMEGRRPTAGVGEARVQGANELCEWASEMQSP